MSRPMVAKGTRLEAAEAAALVRPRDDVLAGFAAGQPTALLEAIGGRRDLEEVTISTGLLVRSYTFLKNSAVRVVSGFYGPVERMAATLGAP